MMRKYFICIIFMLIPNFLIPYILRLLGCHCNNRVRIGYFNIILVDKIELYKDISIGHFNFIRVNSLILGEYSYINYFNQIRGPFDLILSDKAAIGKNNMIIRAKKGITYGESKLALGKLTKINSFHFLDLTRSIVFKDFSILAGVRSQIWTHGYVHAEKGKDRYRVDGEVEIGNNVYIGSGCLINPGVTISNAINVGGNTTVAKSLIESGMYVSSGLRFLSKNYDDIKKSLKKISVDGLVEEVYEK